jgi:hypothetical protein
MRGVARYEAKQSLYTQGLLYFVRYVCFVELQSYEAIRELIPFFLPDYRI